MFRKAAVKTVELLPKSAVTMFKTSVNLPVRQMNFSATCKANYAPLSSLNHNILLKTTCKVRNLFFQQFSSDTNKNSANRVKLKNGSEADISIVVTTMISLEGLINKNPIAFYEFVMKARNPKHDMFGKTQKVVSRLALIDSNGEIHSTVKDIILSAVNGDGLDLKLTSPLLENRAHAENDVSKKIK